MRNGPEIVSRNSDGSTGFDYRDFFGQMTLRSSRTDPAVELRVKWIAIAFVASTTNFARRDGGCIVDDADGLAGEELRKRNRRRIWRAWWRVRRRELDAL